MAGSPGAAVIDQLAPQPGDVIVPEALLLCLHPDRSRCHPPPAAWRHCWLVVGQLARRLVAGQLARELGVTTSSRAGTNVMHSREQFPSWAALLTRST